MTISVVVVFFLIVFMFFYSTAQIYPKMIPIAALFSTLEDVEMQRAFRAALLAYKTDNETQPRFKIEEEERVMKSHKYDTWEVMQMSCAVAKKGCFFIMGQGDYKTHSGFASVANKLNLPFINWALSPVDKLDLFEVSMKPSLTNVIADIVKAKGWKNVTYITDSPEGLNNLERLTRRLREKRHILTANVKHLPKTTNSDTLHNFFYDIHEAHHSIDNQIILDVGDAKLLNDTLKELNVVAVKSKHFHYLIASLNVDESDIIKFRSGVINVTRLQIINHDSKEYRKFTQKWLQVQQESTSVRISIDAALAYDSINVVVNAIHQVLQAHSGLFNYTFKRGELWSYGYPGVYCHPREDSNNLNRPFLPLEHGKYLAKYLRLSSSHGLTGLIEFDDNGFRKGFELKILELLYYSENTASSAETSERWRDGVGFVPRSLVIIKSSAKETSAKIEDDRPLIITTVVSMPFLSKKLDWQKYEGNDIYEGYCVELMHLIARNLSRKFVIQLVKDKGYGNVGPNGEWNGMIGELLRDEADMAVAPLTITTQRERVVDFSKPFMTTGISIMIKKPDKQEFSVFSFMEPLHPEVWMYIIFAYVGVSLMIFLVARFSPYEWRVEEKPNGNLVVSNDFSLYNCLWFTLAAFMQQGTDILPRSVSGRIGSSAWWFFTMIIVSSYTANLAAFLTLEKMHPPIKSAEDLAKQTKIKYGIQAAGSTATFFKESTFPIYQRMWAYMSQEKSVFTKDYAEGIQKVRDSKGNYAFLLEATANQYANTRKPCDTMKVGDDLNTLGYGVATKFGSPLRFQVNLIILELLERGELKKLENRWWYEKSQCEQGMTQDSQSASLTLSKVAGIFYILIGGMVLAMAVALGEFIYRSRMGTRKNNRGIQGMIETQLSIPYRDKSEKDKEVEDEKSSDSVWK